MSKLNDLQAMQTGALATPCRQTPLRNTSAGMRQEPRIGQTQERPMPTETTANFDIPVWTEGVFYDGAALLRDGTPMTITFVLAALNEREELRAENKRLRDMVVKLILEDESVGC